MPPDAASITVRPIAPGDIPRVWELVGELAEYERLTDIVTGTPEMLQAALFSPGDRLRGLVAERGGGGGPARVVGYALFFPVFGSFRARWRLWLEDIYVERAARGTGAGAALMGALARAAVEGGYTAIDWEVLEWNRSAIEFYERFGAGRIGDGWLRYRLEGESMGRAAGGA